MAGPLQSCATPPLRPSWPNGTIGDFTSSGECPWIDNGNANSGEVIDIAGSERRTAGQGNCTYLGVELADRPSCTAVCRDDIGIGIGCITIEGQNPSGKVLAEDWNYCRFKLATTLAIRKQPDAVQDFRLR